MSEEKKSAPDFSNRIDGDQSLDDEFRRMIQFETPDLERYLFERKVIYDRCVAVTALLEWLAKEGKINGDTTLNELRRIVKEEINESKRVKDIDPP